MVSWTYHGSPLGDLDESLCWFAISMDEPEVRRVGFASFALLPPSRARAPLPLWGRGSSGSGGGLFAMLERPKFVPMARPYAFDIPLYLFIYKSRLRKLCLLAPLPGQSSTSPLGEGEFWFGRGALCNAREAEIRTYGSSVCF